jgi:hypothetical protein
VNDQVQRVSDDSTGTPEAWQRLTDDPDIRGVEARRHEGPEGRVLERRHLGG